MGYLHVIIQVIQSNRNRDHTAIAQSCFLAVALFGGSQSRNRDRVTSYGPRQKAARKSPLLHLLRSRLSIQILRKKLHHCYWEKAVRLLNKPRLYFVFLGTQQSLRAEGVPCRYRFSDRAKRNTVRVGIFALSAAIKQTLRSRPSNEPMTFLGSSATHPKTTKPRRHFG